MEHPAPTTHRVQLLSRFAAYRAYVEELYGRTLTGQQPARITNYLSEGATSYVFALPGRPAVIKLPLANSSDLPAKQRYTSARQATELAVVALERGIGLSRLEQIEAYEATRTPSVICQRAPGETYYRLNDQQRRAIPLAHFIDLIQTCQHMQARGLAIDATAENILYHPTQGFTVIDYVYRPQQTLDEKVLALADKDTLLDNIPLHNNLPTYAHTYREAAVRVLGEHIGSALHTQWELHFDIQERTAGKAA